ncbi:MAG: hypothetical protein NC231_01685 [Bacillus sp. (in: Bacteria)]|nr:hypothetical protein [Bacillus sp. (in: firmicutes)]
MLIMFALAGCGAKVADEEKIQTDLTSYKQKDFLAADEKITEIVIDKRQTEKDDKIDTVWCSVQTEDARCAYEKDFTLTYSLYDEGGWILDEVDVNNRSEWVITPLTGVSNEEISASLSGINITADNESWYVTKDNIKAMSVNNQETNLENETDVVTVSLTVDDLVEEAKGELLIHYIFRNGGWVMDSMLGNENFTADMKTSAALSIDDTALFNAVNGQVFEYGSQEISVNKDEISDFMVKGQELSNKGTVQKYLCSCTLTKPCATFSLDIAVPYYYAEGWNEQSADITAKCTSVDIVGVWSGTTLGDYNELNITEMDENGNISGSYVHRGPIKLDIYSYYVTGAVKWDTLGIYLTVGDVIEEAKEWKIKDINAYINIEDSTIEGTGYEYFAVSR